MAGSQNKSCCTVFFKILAWAGFSILLIALLCGTAISQTSLKIGDTFPKQSLTDLNGNRITLPDDATGKIAVIHFLTIWCPLCEREMAVMQLIQTLYGGKGLVSYWIDVGPSAKAGMAYATKTKFTYPVLCDPEMEASKLCGNLNIPITFVCDRKGVIRGKLLGEVTQKGLEKLLSPLLKEASF